MGSWSFKREKPAPPEMVPDGIEAFAERLDRNCTGRTCSLHDLAMLGQPSVETEFCAVCGRSGPLNRHHIVKRSAGTAYMRGREMEKPTVVLCGFGNNLRDADGRPYCHGLAHHGMLHFRWHPTMHVRDGKPVPNGMGLGWWEYLVTEEPVKRDEAMRMEGWRRLCR